MTEDGDMEEVLGRFLVQEDTVVRVEHLYIAASAEEAQRMHENGFKPVDTYKTVIGKAPAKAAPDQPIKRVPMPDDFLNGKPLPYIDERDNRTVVTATCVFVKEKGHYQLTSKDARGKTIDTCTLKKNEALAFLHDKVEEWRAWEIAQRMFKDEKIPEGETIVERK